ncbi:MAG: ABC transporter permease [Syntrophobacteraceae bacterium]|nr:ABC transporter permease [Syntrophobacteraceae bacterium]
MRYRRSLLGIGWIFLNLLIMIFSIGFIYSRLFGQDVKEFIPFLTIGLITWNHIVSGVLEGGNAFIVSEGYIKQIGLPHYVYVFRFFTSITINLLISLPCYFIIALFYGVPFGIGVLWAVPGLMLLCSSSFLMIAIFSHLNARFRDVGHIAGVALQVLFFLTPIMWPFEMLKAHKIEWIALMNPFFHMIEVVRSPLLKSLAASPTSYLVAAVWLLFLGSLAWLVTRCFGQRIPYLL